jgi:hypothetical protein
VIVAEIITRWPAQQRVLRAPYTYSDAPPGVRGLDALALAADDDRAWNRTVARVGGPLDPVTGATLRRLLRDYDGRRIAALHAQLG